MEHLLASLLILFMAIVSTSPSFGNATCGGPIGEVISFKAMANERYVAADLNESPDAPLLANRDWVRTWEKFKIEDTGGGFIALKALANDLYVSADIDSDGKLYADKEKDQVTGKLHDTERFFWITNSDGTISLISKANGRYLAADLNKSPDAPLHANRDWNRTWEKFTTTVTCPITPPERFVDNGDRTITDNETGLMWEKKDGDDGIANLNNPHDVDNEYSWGVSLSPDGTGLSQDGTVFTEFLATLNQDITDDPDSACFAGYCDWRIPRLAELRTIRQESCFFSPCIESIFGPTIGGCYWSFTQVLDFNLIWGVNFLGPDFFGVILPPHPDPGPICERANSARVRAVRGGR